MGDFTSDSLSDALTENRILHRELRATREQLQECRDKPAKTLPRLVVCAIIIRDGKVLLERRAPAGVAGLDGKWDLPGGKVEPGETPETAITREIEEELGVTVFPAKMIPHLPISTWKYADGEQRHWILAAYVCHIMRGEPVLTDTLQWFPLDELDRVDILAADLKLIRMI
jgi:8-oxo-dGTP diphosphatase